MGRLVRKPRIADIEPQEEGFDGMLRSSSRAKPAAVAVAGDNYLERVVKYVPAEIIGCSMVVNAILEQVVAVGGGDATMAGFPVRIIAIGALLMACALTPLFCWYVREDGDAWVVNAMVSTIAFPFWAYLMGAVAFNGYHDGNLATILILAFTLVSGLIAPMAEKPKLREQRAALPMDGPRLVESLTA